MEGSPLGIYILATVNQVLQLWYNKYLSGKAFFLLFVAKSVQMQGFFWPYFPMFELNMKIYSLKLCIQSKYGKAWMKKKLHIWTLFMQCDLF